MMLGDGSVKKRKRRGNTNYHREIKSDSEFNSPIEAVDESIS
jgi:hypothetical protein